MAPVFPIGVGATARPRHFSAMGAQPRTQIARDNPRIQRLQSCGPGHEDILLLRSIRGLGEHGFGNRQQHVQPNPKHTRPYAILNLSLHF